MKKKTEVLAALEEALNVGARAELASKHSDDIKSVVVADDVTDEVAALVALERLDRILNGTKFELSCVQVLRGLSVSDCTDLGNGISLLPIEALPQSPNRDVILEGLNARKFYLPQPLAIGPDELSQDACVLVGRVMLGSPFYDAAEYDPLSSNGDEITEEYKRISDAIRCLIQMKLLRHTGLHQVGIVIRMRNFYRHGYQVVVSSTKILRLQF